MLAELSKMKKINRIKRADYDRILITETLPYETPIIFSNDGLYNAIKNVASAPTIQSIIVNAIIFGKPLKKFVSSTIPYTYKIRKNAAEFRRLALLHPQSQWRLKLFYQEYEDLILHYRGDSPASIRSPERIAGSFYSKSSWENVNQYKTGNVQSSVLDRYSKHAPSYFAYRGYDRLYKFFISREYLALEKKFDTLLTLDVSKCFDSIYTHGLAWAVKDKQFTKTYSKLSATFANEFDVAIRHGNYNETNGIPIGPEASRIFAEILFQEIDRRAINRLSDRTLEVDYTFRRYVDDVFIFADSPEIAQQFYAAYADVLTAFNLHANTSKSTLTGRPFVTKKSRLVHEASRISNEFFDKFLSKDDGASLSPSKIFSPWRLTRSYIDAIKSLCASDEADYDEVAAYLIAVLTERIKKIAGRRSIALDEETRRHYVAAVEILLDVSFFLYSVSPSVSASYKLSTSIILALRFINKYVPESSLKLSQQIYDLAWALLTEHSNKHHGSGIDGFVHLECLNLILALRELGDHYLLPEALLERLFTTNRKLTYFTIISCLFYIKDTLGFDQIRKKLIVEIGNQLRDMSDIFENSEKAHLFLDVISCPYIDAVDKMKWGLALCKLLDVATPTNIELAAFAANSTQYQWHVDWIDVDLLNSLEKKELKQAY